MQHELNDLRDKANMSSTLRPTVQAIEDILYLTHNVLPGYTSDIAATDSTTIKPTTNSVASPHPSSNQTSQINSAQAPLGGFIRVIDYMGNDDAIVQAARVSYGRGTKKSLQDRGLINYLLRHNHTTPFEMCEIKFHVKLPIFVARQWIRHRTANVNEYSARYSVLDKEFYIPDAANLSAQSTTNKQGREETISAKEAEAALQILKSDAIHCYNHYEELMNIDSLGNVINPDHSGIARELARMNLTLNCYTQWYWKVDLHNLLRFVRLRADKHAQFEIRAYADVMLQIIEKWVPYTFEAFQKYQLNGANFSSQEIAIIRQLLLKQPVDIESMNPREFSEFQSKLNLDISDIAQKL